MPPLFLQKPEYETLSGWQHKLAGVEVKLGPDPNAWPEQILQEAFKSIPALKDYQPNVVMQHMDPETLCAFGALVITTHGDPNKPSPYTKSVYVPILIKEGKLLPMDLLVKQGTPETPTRTYPLNERRLRKALFRPDVYDILTPPPTDTSLTNALFPPARDGYNGSGGFMGMGKVASLLGAALPLASERQVRELQVGILSEKTAFRMNPCAVTSLEKLASHQHRSLREEIEQKVASAAPSTVVQYRSNGDGTYTVKHAAAGAWAPRAMLMSRNELLKVASAEQVADLDTKGEVTLGLDGGAGPTSDTKPLKPITKAGLYEVRTLDGKELIGVVFPNLIGFDGVPSPSAFFTNGSEATLQASIGGNLLSTIPARLSTGGPRPSSGAGHWIGSDAEGEFEATVPMELQGGMASMAGSGYRMKSVDGDEGTVEIIPGLQSIQAIDGKLLIPSSYTWMPIGKEKAGALEGPTQPSLIAQKTASLRPTELVLGGHGSLFSLHGPAVDKLASEDKQGLSVSEALFTMVGVGVDPSYAVSKLAEAYSGQRGVKIAARWAVEPLGSRVDGYVDGLRKVAAAAAGQLPKVSLVKEAGYMGDSESIDTLLSLNLLSPETLSAFVEGLPQLEETQERLCGLLLASRLGLKEIPAAALEKAITGLEPVIDGLYALRFQEPGTLN